MRRPLLALVTGGARSGKSRFALARATSLGRPRVFLATGEGRDDEMAARIARHRAERDPAWRTVEEPIEIARALRAEEGSAVVVDCLTLWLANLFDRGRDVRAAGDELLSALLARRAAVVLVTNELGSGIVPENALARDYRDAAGFLNQQVADLADEVHLLVCGQPLRIK